MQNKEGKDMKKIYEKATVKMIDLGKQDIVTLSGFLGKDDVFPLSNEETEEETASV
jgi:hypothetical protein